jgi:BirA family biotin operon repressor/biotin-[acetyl-CoA-carboxylase] ligase
MPETELFSILDTVDSTNNYAMAAVHAGLARHGMAWFAREQTAGKGQRGKVWQSRPGQNIALSIVLKPKSIFSANHFMLNAVVARECHRYFNEKAGGQISIKWPNDIYWRDRKAGGILIENIFAAKTWKWAVAGIGLNINQDHFHGSLRNVTSLGLITGKEWSPEHLARELHERIIAAFAAVTAKDFDELLAYYNQHLFRKGETVKLKKDAITFTTTVKSVNPFGQLITQDAMERQFNFGEVEWVI